MPEAFAPSVRDAPLNSNAFAQALQTFSGGIDVSISACTIALQDSIRYGENMAKWFFLALSLMHLSESEWKDLLGEERYRVMRLKDREPGFVGEYLYTKDEGIYHCAACSNALFSSDDKYDSASGWPSFTKPVHPKAVFYQEDFRPPFKRYEVLCRSCNCHLGHIFNDGPPPKNTRYAIQSIALKLLKK